MGLFDAIGGLLGGGNDGGATDTQKKALEEFSKLQIPDADQLKIQLQKLVQQGTITPEQAQTFVQGKSEMGNIETDPEYMNAAKTALSGLQDVYQQGGLTDIDRARIADIQDKEAQAEKGSREAIIQNAQERGVGGSGLELAQQLQNEQGAATRKASEDLTVNADAQKRALDALTQAGTMGAGLQAQEFGQEAQKASAQDVINKFNTQNQNTTSQINTAANNAAQTANLQEKQRVADTNTGITNQQEIQNKGTAQTVFNDQLQKANGMIGEANKISDTELENQKRKENLGAGVVNTGATLLAGLSDGGRIPGDAPEEGDDPENDQILALLSPGETVVPRSVADDPAAAAEFAKNPPPADVPKTSVNSVVAKMLMDKYGTAAQGGGDNNSTPAPAADYSPEARQKLLDSMRKPDTSQLVARALAGLGDSVLNSNGAKASGVSTERDIENTKRDRALEGFNAGREDIQYKRTMNQQGEMDDPNSSTSKGYQAALAEMLGKKPEDIAGLSATQIAQQFPSAEKLFTARESHNARIDAAKIAADSRKDMHDMMVGTKENQQQDKLEQNFRQGIMSVRGDTSLKNTEVQRDAAITAYNRIQQVEKSGKTLNPIDYVDILGQIYKARTGAAPTEVVLKEAKQQTLKGNYGKAWTMITGEQAPATTQDIQDSLKDMVAHMGLQADQLHDRYMAPHVLPPSGLDKDRADRIVKEGRGISFAEATGVNPDDYSGKSGAGSQVMTATNPKTKEKIKSMDGGKTWQKA